jgi:hypothetical protein
VYAAVACTAGVYGATVYETVMGTRRRRIACVAESAGLELGPDPVDRDMFSAAWGAAKTGCRRRVRRRWDNPGSAFTGPGGSPGCRRLVPCDRAAPT